MKEQHCCFTGGMERERGKGRGRREEGEGGGRGREGEGRGKGRKRGGGGRGTSEFQQHTITSSLLLPPSIYFLTNFLLKRWERSS